MAENRQAAGVRATRLVLLISVVVLGSGCFKRWVDFKAHRILAIRVSSIDDRGFDLVVRCELENPNALGATIRDVSFAATTGGHSIGKGRFAGPLKVAKRSRFNLDAPVRVHFTDLPSDFPGRVKNGRIPLRIATRFAASTSLGSYDMELVSVGSPEVAKAIEVAISGSFRGKAMTVKRVGVGSIGLRGSRIDLLVVARNYFAFPLRIRKARYSLSIDGKHFGRGLTDKPIGLPARGKVETTLSVTATHGAIGRALSSVLGANPRFRVTGTIWVDPIGGVSRIPFDLTADASVFEH